MKSSVIICLQALKYQQKHLDIAQQEGNGIEEQRAYTTIGRTHLIQIDTMQGKCLI